MDNALTNPLGSTLGDYNRLKQAEGQQQQMKQRSLFDTWTSPSSLPGASTPSLQRDWVDTQYTSIPIEIYNKKTGEVVKKYNNAIDYQMDTMVVSGGSTAKPNLSVGEALPGQLG